MEIISITFYFVVIILLFSFFIITVIWRKIKKYSPFWEDFGKIITIITAILVVSVIYIELKELRNQTEITEQSFRQTYRPLGVIDPGKKENFYTGKNKKGKLNFTIYRKIINKGKGILFFIGNVRFVTDHEINFYSDSLIQYIESSNIPINLSTIDKINKLQRFMPVLPEEEEEIEIPFTNINSLREYYFYTIIFYKDQNKNLYDTINMYYYLFEEPYIHNKGIEAKNYIENEFYHSYSTDEQNKLADIIEPIHPSFASCIRHKKLK